MNDAERLAELDPDGTFIEGWKRDTFRRAWVRQIDRAIRRAQTPARLYKIRDHRRNS
jgi:hypothetical protein